MNALLKIDKGISYLEKVIMIIAIIVMASVLFANVVGRIVFHHSLTFAEELGTMGTVYVTFVGLSYCARVGEHIAMTAIFDALKGKARKVLMIIIALVVLLFGGKLTGLFGGNSGDVSSTLQQAVSGGSGTTSSSGSSSQSSSSGSQGSGSLG